MSSVFVNVVRRWRDGFLNGGTLSSASFQKYRTAFGRSVDSWSSVPDMDRHIEKKNEEFGLNIEPLGS